MNNHNEKQHDPEMTMHQVLAVCRMALMVDAEALSALLNQFSYEESAGPVVDPTGHRAVMGKMYNAHEACNAFAVFHRCLRRINAKERDRLAHMKATP